MEARYSRLPYPPLNLNSLPPSTAEMYWNEDGATRTRKASLAVRISAVWTLDLYLILSVGVTIFVLVYVESRHFNLTERSPPVHIDNGTLVTPFRPMQSDIVTFLSSIIAILKCAMAAWTTSLCWYAALFLVERRGLARRDLKTLLKYGQLALGACSGDWSTLVIGILLVTTLVANFSSPILTGSISWIPSNRLVHGLSIHPIGFGDVVDGTLKELLPVYYKNYNVREAYVMGGVGKVGLGWGRENDKDALKRVPGSVETLAINSTIENFTLPYFQVHSIRWIENRGEIPGIRDGNTPTDVLHPILR